MSSPLEDWLNERIPDEMYFDTSWQPKYLPSLSDPLGQEYGWDEIVADMDENFAEDEDANNSM